MRRILISGANGGIGNAIAEQAFEDGHKLSLGIRNFEKFKGTSLEAKSNSSNRVFSFKYDALDPNSASIWVKNTIEVFGGIDTIIHCAGILHKTELLFSDSEMHQLDELWKTNLMGPWLLTRAAWEHISNERNGRIIVLVSMSGKRSKTNLAGYSASKFALRSLCQSIRNEGWGNGTRVTAISPGWVNTEMAKEVRAIPKEEMTQPHDIALICSNILKMENSCVPFEIDINCNLEK